MKFLPYCYFCEMEGNVILDLSKCTACPRNCGVNRYTKEGFCRIGVEPIVSSVFPHKGEEPVISGKKGICNVFFAHCNLQCVFCQNYQISRNNAYSSRWLAGVEPVVKEIISILDTGVTHLGFVSPSHQVPQMLEIISLLNKRGYKPITVYNSNGYDNVETLKALEGLIDVYLPDFKYYDGTLSWQYSGVTDYFEVAGKAVKEMYRQKGSSLVINEEGLVEFGLIIRHLVLPEHSADSIAIFKFLAEEISPRLYISLMSQYYPPSGLKMPYTLGRHVSAKEYNRIVNVLHKYGFRGWVQELESSQYYRPDFSADSPFSE